MRRRVDEETEERIRANRRATDEIANRGTNTWQHGPPAYAANVYGVSEITILRMRKDAIRERGVS